MPSLRHVAIIMDGNGRWAKRLDHPRKIGHKYGAETVGNIVNYAVDIKLPVLTLFAFSCDNWKRPQSEVDTIFDLFQIFILQKLELLKDANVRIKVLGRRDNLYPKTLEVLELAEQETVNNTGLILNIAFNYSGRDEIVRATKKLAELCVNKKLNIDDITIDKFSDSLDTSHCCDPDLVIRTSGELRISNFLLWQMAYSEFYFVDSYWPDFTVELFQEAVDNYNNRERRYGNVSEN